MCGEIIEEWQSMFNNIENALFDLRADQCIFRGFMEIVESNPALPSNNLFIVWAWRNYLYTAAMRVRRQISTDSRDASLVNLLEAIKREPAVLSRQRYASLFKGAGVLENDSAFINKCFDDLVGEGKQSLSPTDITEDIDCLKKTAGTLHEYATKIVAHADKNAESIKTLPTIKDLDDSIDLFEKTFNRYYGLLNAGGIGFPKVANDPWKEIFLRPWKLDKKNLI